MATKRKSSQRKTTKRRSFTCTVNLVAMKARGEKHGVMYAVAPGKEKAALASHKSAFFDRGWGKKHTTGMTARTLRRGARVSGSVCTLVRRKGYARY